MALQFHVDMWNRLNKQNGTFEKRKRPKSKGILLLEENLAGHIRLTSNSWERKTGR